MTNTTESADLTLICRDTCCHGAPRYRIEDRRCMQYRGSTSSMCLAPISVVLDRHSLDGGARVCESCAKLATIRFHLTGVDGGESITILDGMLMSGGERLPYCTDYETIRRWARNAAADGVRRITLTISRITRNHETRSRRVSLA